MPMHPLGPDPSYDFADTMNVSMEQALHIAGDADGVLLTSDSRLARALCSRHDRARFAAGEACWETPSILSLTHWLEALHDAALASGHSERVRIAPLMATHRWRRSIEADDTLTTVLLPARAAETAWRSWRLAHAWRCLPSEGSRPVGERRHWQSWAQAYAASLEEDALVDAATLPDHVAALIADGAIVLPREIVIAGLLAPTPQQRALVAALVMAGARVAQVEREPVVTPHTECWADDDAELHGVADALFRHLERTPSVRLGVIVPRLDARRDALRRALDRRFFPVATPAEIDAAGRPYDLHDRRALADAPPVRAAMLSLALAFEELVPDDLSALLLCPYLAHADVRCRARQRLDGQLRDWRVQRASLGGFATWLGTEDPLSAPLRAYAKGRRGPAGKRHARLAEWAGRFTSGLRAFGWPGPSLVESDRRAVLEWQAALDDLSRFDDESTWGSGDALRLLRELVAGRQVGAMAVERPITVLGRLQSSGHRFDALWVIGLDAERWPPAAEPDAFLTMEAQREAALPGASSRARLALARHELASWCTAAPVVTVSCAKAREGRALERAFVLRDAGDAHGDVHDPLPMIRRAATLERLDDSRGPVCEEAVRVRGGSRLLERQARCPLRAFVEHRLGGRPVEPFASGLGHRRRGSLLHAALEHVWSTLRTQRALLALDAAGLGALIATAVEVALERERVDRRLRSIEATHLASRLHRWIDTCERTREPFEVIAIEETFPVEHAGVTLDIKIDRIDRVGDRLLVIDYKSGEPPPLSAWNAGRLVSAQLPLYALTDEAIAGAAFAAAGRRRPVFVGTGCAEVLAAGMREARGLDDVGGGWEGLRAHWRDALGIVATEIRTGLASVAPLDRNDCESCEVRPVCRRDVAATHGIAIQEPTVPDLA